MFCLSCAVPTNSYRTMKTIDTALPVPDPVIQEVRRHKLAIAEEFGCDVVALGRSLQQRQMTDSRFTTTKGEDGGATDGDKPPC